ncbi:MAG: S-layer homology domain-containing protein, partial [Lachnospiraceae bacterium]|nr:S-layer homology domain-containing protein [Lachnospiraceae bacterium]
FDAAGGSGYMESFTVDSGTEITLPECAFDAPDGYYFYRWDKGFAGATYQVVSDVTITAQWIPIPTGTELTAVGLTGVTLPRIGEHPTVEGITVPEGANYHVFYLDCYNVTDNAWMTASDVFEEGKYYRLYASFAPNEGYYFADADEMTFTLEGVSAEEYSYQLYSFGELPYTGKTVYCDFGPLEPETVGEVVLHSGPLPVIGQTLSIADFGLSVPVEAGYTVVEALWSDASTEAYDSEMTFEAGKTYRLVIGLLPKAGYAFALGEDVTAELVDILDVRYRPLGNYNVPVHGIEGGLVVTFDFTPRASWVNFTDVADPSQFYFDPVYWCADRGYVAGWGDGTFRPMNNCNRAAVVTFLWRMAGRPEPTAMATFSDMTGNEVFDKAISWAAENGITTGWADNTFRPWNTCNRAAIVTFLWRFAGEPEASAPAAFSDMTGNEDFDSAISWAVEHGIVTGWADNTFRPWNQCLRLAVVSFLYRYAMDRRIM